jgi:hypothetical protein
MWAERHGGARTEGRTLLPRARHTRIAIASRSDFLGVFGANGLSQSSADSRAWPIMSSAGHRASARSAPSIFALLLTRPRTLSRDPLLCASLCLRRACLALPCPADAYQAYQFLVDNYAYA